jgi:hypothetical protein
MKALYGIPDLNWQAVKEFNNDSDQLARLNFSIVLCIDEMLKQAEQQIQVLHGLFTDALLRLPEDEGGRRKDWPLHTFILQLKEIWEKGTGKKAGRSRHPRTREIGGPFVRVMPT